MVLSTPTLMLSKVDHQVLLDTDMTGPVQDVDGDWFNRTGWADNGQSCGQQHSLRHE